MTETTTMDKSREKHIRLPTAAEVRNAIAAGLKAAHAVAASGNYHPAAMANAATAAVMAAEPTEDKRRVVMAPTANALHERIKLAVRQAGAADIGQALDTAAAEVSATAETIAQLEE